MEFYLKYVYLHLLAFPSSFAFVWMQTSQVAGNQEPDSSTVCDKSRHESAELCDGMLQTHWSARLLLLRSSLLVVPGYCIAFLSPSCSNILHAQQVR